MLPKKPHSPEQTQRWTFTQLFGLVRRHPLMISRWVLCWALVGTVCGLFAGLYWNILELMTHALKHFEGPSLLIVMPLAGLIIGLVIYFLGNPGWELHRLGIFLDTIWTTSMILPWLSSME